MSALNEWERHYNLDEARRHPSRRTEAAHQATALSKLRAWYESAPTPDAGGLLVLPTGGGKTFTAVRFLCRNPLSDGYKVLWLAHTHHLLEQALDSFGKPSQRADEMEVGLIHEPKERLLARVVSGTPGHSRIAAVTPHDDVVICTLQTAVRAYREKHAALDAFIDSAKGKLMVVFDEAHHAPAPSYTQLILDLRKRVPKMKLLGLTATPMYNDQSREGWIEQLFPQRILYQISASKLIAAGILAKPIPKPCPTTFVPKFDPTKFQRWRATYQDVPEDIITQLAENQERNDTIWKTYVDDRPTFGKTIIFADRWFQCDYLREKLRANGVRADVVYSHVDADPGSVEARNRRNRDDNAKVLQAFREGRLDVLINVRMLTEGTDVPDVQSVFITRQTTSEILLRQMVGRALRGPQFKGTATANIVFFTDQWREAVQWAEVGDTWGTVTEGTSKPRERLPLRLVSIDLIRRLARQMETGELGPASFLDLLPLGWYTPEYDVEVLGSDDSDHVRPMVLVYTDERGSYEAFLEQLAKGDLTPFADPGLAFDSIRAQIEGWKQRFFADERARTNAVGMNLFHLVRHLAQAGGKAPAFFPFEHRERHDLTPLAKVAAAEDWGPKRTWQHLEGVYHDERHFWRALFPTFDDFRVGFRHLVDAEIQRQTGAGGLGAGPIVIGPPQPNGDREPSETVKNEVKRRDGCCLCCGSKRKLQVDHIVSSYHGGANDPANLQTLCSICNRYKGVNQLHFRKTQTLLTSAPPFQFPAGFTSDDLDDLRCDVQRTINMFYQCAAVDLIDKKQKGIKRREWLIRLRSGNPSTWFEPHLDELFERIRAAQQGDRSGPVRRFILQGAEDALGEGGLGVRAESDEAHGAKSLRASEIRPRRAVALYWPAGPDMPNQVIDAKVVRVDEKRRVATVRATIGRSERFLEGVPYKALFDWDDIGRREDVEEIEE